MICSIILCKSLIHVFFEHTIKLFDDTFLPLFHERSQTTNDYFNDSQNKVLLSVSSKRTFIVFLHDNIYKINCFIDAKNYFHKTTMTAWQFRTIEHLSGRSKEEILSINRQWEKVWILDGESY